MEHNYLDENLIQEGWDDMSKILDREMPQKKERKVAFIWWRWSIGLAALALLLGGFFTHYFSKNTTQIVQNKVENVEKNSLSNNKPEVEKNTQNIEEKSTFFESKTAFESSNLEKINTKKIYLNQKNEETQNRVEVPKDLTKNTLQSSDNELLRGDFEENKESKNIAISTESTEKPVDLLLEKNENIEVITLKNLPKELEIPLPKTVSEYGIKKPLKNRKMLFAASLAYNFEPSTLGFVYPNYNFQLGASVGKRVGKHLFEGTIFFEKIKKSTPIVTQKIQIETLANHTQSVEQLVYPYTCNCFDDFIISSESPLISTKFLVYQKSNQYGLGFNYGFRANAHWELNTGIEATFATTKVYGISFKKAEILNWNSFGSGLNIQLNSDTKEYNFDPNSMNPSISKNDTTNPVEIIRNTDIYGKIGASYYLRKNFKVSASIRRGFLDLTPNDKLKRKDFSNFLQLKMTKYF